MARSVEFAITNAGKNLIAQSIQTGKAIIFTGANVGTGVVADSVDLKTVTAMVTPISQGASIGNKKLNSDGNVVITVVYENSALTAATYLEEIGIFAKLDGGNAVLFGYMTLGQYPTMVTAASVAKVVRRFEFVVAMGSGNAVTVTTNPDELINRDDVGTTKAGQKLLYTNENGVIDADITGNAMKLNGHSDSYFATASSVSQVEGTIADLSGDAVGTLVASGRTLTLKAVDGTTIGSVTTQDTTYSGGVAISIVNGAINVTTVPVANGGTGATTAAGARSNLGITPSNIGAAPSSHSHSDATTAASGYMSKEDKAKLDGITESADSVSFSRSLTSGTKIGTLTINGSATDLYCQTNTNTTYTAGTGLSLAGTVFSVGTVPVANGGTGSTTAAGAITNLGITPAAIGASATNHSHSAASTTAAGFMSKDDKAKLNGITADADSVSFSQVLTSGTKIGTITINGTATDLYCQTNTNTTYSAGTGLSLSGTKFSVSTVPVANGGTGATTAADARTNLGAAASSHTHNYAGSSSAGGAATSAAKLTNTSAIGSATKPVYFTNGGVPAACTYTLGNNVPAVSVFTDHVTVPNTNSGLIVNMESTSGATTTTKISVKYATGSTTALQASTGYSNHIIATGVGENLSILSSSCVCWSSVSVVGFYTDSSSNVVARLYNPGTSAKKVDIFWSFVYA